jgi:hypothetical protein
MGPASMENGIEAARSGISIPSCFLAQPELGLREYNLARCVVARILDWLLHAFLCLPWQNGGQDC